MENVNLETKRKVGGNSFTDSIIRTNAVAEQYVKYVLSLVSKKVIKDKVLLSCTSDALNISIKANGIRLFSISNEDVEKFRQNEVLAFDKFIINMLKFAKFNIDETSDYYKRVDNVVI